VGLFVVEVFVGLVGLAFSWLEVVAEVGVPGDGIVELGPLVVGFVMLGSSGSVCSLGLCSLVEGYLVAAGFPVSEEDDEYSHVAGEVDVGVRTRDVGS
jgi:hypothetical protein